MSTSRFIRRLFPLLLACLGSVSSTHAATATGGKPGPAERGRVLFIVSSSKVHGASALPASISFDEVVHAWDTFHAAGYAVDFVSPEGGSVPILPAYVGQATAARLKDARIMDGLRNTARPAQLDPARYRAVYYVGGSNAIYGVPDNQALQNIAMHVYERNGGVVSAVCHGTAGLVNLRLSDGRYLVAGKRITGYPEQYEDQEAAYFKQFPFLIGQTITARGGVFGALDRDQSHVEVDGRVVTGQNYPSSAKVAEAVVEILRQGPAQAQAQAGEHAAVDRVMQTMMSGFTLGDPKVMFEVLRRDAVVLGYVQSRGQVATQSGEEWANGFTGAPANDEAQRKRSYQILDVGDTAAVVKVTLDYPRWEGHDYLSLSKIDGEWKIVSKSWSGKTKPPAR